MDYYRQLMNQLNLLGVETSLEELEAAFSVRILNKGDHFIRQGEIERQIAFLCSGLMRYYYITVDGDDVTKHFACEGDFATSYASMIYQRPTAYNIVCEETCHVLIMDYDTYMEQIMTVPKWERVARLYTENIYNLKELREAALLTMNATDRYLSFLKQYPEIEKRLKQKHIATYLGIHPVSLSRLKKSIES